MITAGEIRIGNLIYMELYKGQAFGPEILEDVVKEVIEVDPNVIVCIHDGAKHYFPIPLTPEILVALGFELLPWGYVKKSMKDFGVRLNVLSFSYDVSGNNPVRLKYLHQLQNLYFSLTGEELTLTELNKK